MTREWRRKPLKSLKTDSEVASGWLARQGRVNARSPLSRLNAEVTPEKPHHVLFRDGPTEQIALRLRDRA